MPSKRIASLTPSATHAMTARIAQLRAAGEKVFPFHVGEPDFPTPQPIVEACVRALAGGMTKYTPTPGILALREAICEKLERENGLRYAPEQICVSNGAKQALSNAVLALCDEANEVLIPTPCYLSYPEIVRLAGGVPVSVPTRADFAPDVDALRSAITPRTRLILLNSPNNPSGAVYSRSSLEAIGALVLEHDLHVISDEVYEKLVFDGAEHVSIASLSPELYARTVVVGGFSKSFAMTGWRLGYTASSRELCRACDALQGHMTSCATSFVQAAALAALSDCAGETEAMRREFEARRDEMHRLLCAMPGIRCALPQGAFYLLPDVSALFGKRANGREIASAADLCAYLLDTARVAAVPGDAFCLPGTIRLAYTCPIDVIREGMARMAKALEKLED